MIAKLGWSSFWVFEPSFAQRADALAAQYTNARPFPHIVLDNFLPPEMADFCSREFPARQALHTQYAGWQENLKFEYKPELLCPALRGVFYAFNSAPFIRFLEHLTGIKGLLPDPYFAGAGFHEVANGGHLNIHADFNHHTDLDLERRINVLIYLNHDWHEEYGGCLELWNQAMTQCEQRVLPSFNRCVVFNTSSTSFHGNPEPVNHPAGISRRSIALYYYTATWDGSQPEHSTLFKARANSHDGNDFSERLGAITNELLPPIASRVLQKVMRRLRRRRAVSEPILADG